MTYTTAFAQGDCTYSLSTDLISQESAEMGEANAYGWLDTLGNLQDSKFDSAWSLGDLLEGGSVAVYALAEDGSRALLEVIATEDLLLSGYSTVGTTLTLSLDDLPTRSLVVVADDDGTGVGIIDECDEDNNELKLEGLCEAE